MRACRKRILWVVYLLLLAGIFGIVAYSNYRLCSISIPLGSQDRVGLACFYGIMEIRTAYGSSPGRGSNGVTVGSESLKDLDDRIEVLQSAGIPMVRFRDRPPFDYKIFTYPGGAWGFKEIDFPFWIPVLPISLPALLAVWRRRDRFVRSVDVCKQVIDNRLRNLGIVGKSLLFIAVTALTFGLACIPFELNGDAQVVAYVLALAVPSTLLAYLTRRPVAGVLIALPNGVVAGLGIALNNVWDSDDRLLYLCLLSSGCSLVFVVLGILTGYLGSRRSL